MESIEPDGRAADAGRRGLWELDVVREEVFLDASAASLIRADAPTSASFDASTRAVLGAFDAPTAARLRGLAARAVRRAAPFDVELVLVTVGGARIAARLMASPIVRDGRVVRLAGLVEKRRFDIDETQRWRLLAQCVERLNDIVVITEAGPLDEPGPRIVFVNEAFTRQTGYLPHEVLGRSPRFLQGARTDRAELQRIGFALRQWQTVRAELINYAKNGGDFAVEMEITPIADRHGVVTHWVAVQRDVTARRKAEALATLQEAQRVESIGTLATGIAHDFNNVVASILGNVAIAQKDLTAGRTELTSLDQIRKTGLWARDLVHRILAYSRRQPQPLTVQPLDRIVDDALDLLRSTMPPGHRLESDLAARPLWVRADATQLCQVIVNLGTNASHALGPHAGHIRVTLDRIELGEEAPSPAGVALDSGAYARITLSDDGTGMDEATLGRVFEPYFTTKKIGQGTGLGLSMVWGIVAAHHGRITASSVPGAGSSFVVLLPLTSALEAAVSPPASKAATPPAIRGQRVLYVDDDEVLGLMIEGLLGRDGFQVTWVADPAEAVALVQASPLRFDVVVTDLNMPVMSGLDVARAVGRIRPGLPVVVCSGFLPETFGTDALQAGVARFFNKEFAAEELTGLLQDVLSGRDAALVHGGRR